MYFSNQFSYHFLIVKKKNCCYFFGFDKVEQTKCIHYFWYSIILSYLFNKEMMNEKISICKNNFEFK